MSSYLTFVLVLTAIYIIYYAVIITKDLYGKKDDAKTTEEVFDVSSMADAEESVAVEEDDGGFSIGGNSYDTQVDAVTGNDADNTNGGNEQSAETEQNGTDESDDTDNESAFDKLKAKMEKLLEDTDTFMSNPMTDQELYTAMIMRDPKLKWHMVKNEL